MAEFTEVTDDDQIEALAELADVLYHQYSPDIVPEEQVDYMVGKFLTADAIREQREQGNYEYYFIDVDGEHVGFIGIEPQEEKLFLSKLYLTKAHRGKGYSSEAFSFLENMCRDRDLDAIWLTVNKNNHHALDVYKVKGFETVRAQTVDIGEGFIMDDYVLEKEV